MEEPKVKFEKNLNSEEKLKEQEFQNEFMSSMRMKDKELQGFLNKNFSVEKRNENDFLKIQKKCDYLEGLSNSNKNISLARLKQLEDNNDLSKFLPGTAALVALLFTMVTFIFVNSETLGANVRGVFMAFEMLLIAALILMLMRTISNCKKYRSTGIYTNALLANSLKEKKPL